MYFFYGYIDPLSLRHVPKEKNQKITIMDHGCCNEEDKNYYFISSQVSVPGEQVQPSPTRGDGGNLQVPH